MIEQWGIALFGVLAVVLTQDPQPARRRYACLFGLASQPFWFYAAWKSGQWGIGVVTLLYTLAWGRGAWLLWRQRRASAVRMTDAAVRERS